MLDALIRTNMEHSDGYGTDAHCVHAGEMIKKMNKFIVRDNAAGKYFMKFQDDIKSTTEYYRGSSKHKQISSTRLRSFMKNYTNSATPTKITYYQNTKANRNKYLK